MLLKLRYPNSPAFYNASPIQILSTVKNCIQMSSSSDVYVSDFKTIYDGPNLADV